MAGVGAGAIVIATLLPCAAAFGAINDPASRNEQRIAQATQACSEIAEHEVEIVPHGFIITTRNVFVPQSEAKPSPDGRYWICATGDRGFFVPAGRY
jgi:hypothetical protein